MEPALWELKEQLSRPNYSPGKNLFVVESVGELVGCLDITPELNIGRAVLNCLVHPCHRRKGLASKLFFSAQKRMQELGLTLAHINIHDDNEAGKAALARLGFKYIRKYLEMQRSIVHYCREEIKHSAPANIRYLHLCPGQEEELTRLQNKAFEGSWGFNPNTVEEIRYRINLKGSSAKDVILAYEGSRPVGYCWTKRSQERAEGRIHMLGVDPDYRGRGISKGLLAEALSYLKGKGIELVKLTVDSHNLPAYRLYRSLQFTAWASTLWFEKKWG